MPMSMKGRIPVPTTEQEGAKNAEREFFIDNLLVRIHFIIVMIRWTGLAPWEFEFPFPGSLTGAGRVGLASRDPLLLIVSYFFFSITLRPRVE